MQGECNFGGLAGSWRMPTGASTLVCIGSELLSTKYHATSNMKIICMILYFCNFSPIFFTGYFKGDSMVQTMAKLRTIKVNSNDERITPMTELAFIPRKTNGQYPGLFIFTGASRCIYYTYFFQFK